MRLVPYAYSYSRDFDSASALMEFMQFIRARITKRAEKGRVLYFIRESKGAGFYHADKYQARIYDNGAAVLYIKTA